MNVYATSYSEYDFANLYMHTYSITGKFGIFETKIIRTFHLRFLASLTLYTHFNQCCSSSALYIMYSCLYYVYCMVGLIFKGLTACLNVPMESK